MSFSDGSYVLLHDQIDELKRQYEQYRYLMAVLPIAVRAKVIVETGLSNGYSTHIFCEAAKLVGARVYTYDIEDAPETRKKLVERGLSSVWTFRLEDSVKGGKDWKGNSIDILFLDSNHTADHVKKELEAWTPHLSPAGIILIHDTYDPDPQKRVGSALAGAQGFVQENPQWFLMNLIVPLGMGVIWRR